MNNRHSTSSKDVEINEIVLQELPIDWKWLFFIGISLLIFGTLGLLASNFLTLASVILFGGFIFAGGLLQIILGIQAKETTWGGKFQHFLIAILYLITGAIIFIDPVATSVVLTIFIASLFAVIGGIRIWYAFFSKKQGWKWLLSASLGLINLVLAAIIIATLPESALWLIGMMIAIEMLFNGWFLLLISLRVKNTSL